MYYFKDLMILGILILAPTIGSLVTVFACLIGLYHFKALFLGEKNKINQSLRYIAVIYTVYIVYFLVNGSVASGINVTLVSMAPNLPILFFAIVAELS